jgi:hypothetical protein
MGYLGGTTYIDHFYLFMLPKVVGVEKSLHDIADVFAKNLPMKMSLRSCQGTRYNRREPKCCLGHVLNFRFGRVT